MFARFVSTRCRVLVQRLTKTPSIRWHTVAPKPLFSWTEKRKMELYNRVNTQKDTGELSWDTLSKTYRMSADSLRDLYDQIAAKIQSDTQLQTKISDSAQRNYDKEAGKVDWERVAHEVDLTVLECLKMFSYDRTNIKQREISRPEEWTKSDIYSLSAFIESHYPTKSSISWINISKYTNIRTRDCVAKYNLLQKHEWTDEEMQQLVKYRKNGLSWIEIKRKMGIPITTSEYRKIHGKAANNQIKRKPFKKTRSLFSANERNRVREIYNENLDCDCNDPWLIDLVAAEFPAKSRQGIEDALSRIYATYAKSGFQQGHKMMLFKLVGLHGQDWIKIGKMMNRHPLAVKGAWFRFKDKYKAGED